ncbi:UNVERIFIED_CONTAM: hypothetical protein PYX00_000619 [Menopon gallinae]|uniref:Uncharacterized protein n=1 Tax=Menopon gallinae TaxID=328185 RepID=A0AAW2I9R5_9NEOP
MPYANEEDSCDEFMRRQAASPSMLSLYPESDFMIDVDPCIIPVYNDKILNISADLVSQSLSGISLKHYYGNCLRPRESISDEVFAPEDFYTDYEGGPEEEERDPQQGREMSMMEMMKLCYTPRVRHKEEENMPEGGDDFDKPLCLREAIHDRNSFWNLHRPELCKLTWPHDYVSEAVVTDHLHKHLLSHGPLCAPFHDPADMLAMLNREFDMYDDLKVLFSPRDIPPDEKVKHKYVCSNKNMTYEIDDCDEMTPMRICKEEFCITIGRPVEMMTMREVLKTASQSELGSYWRFFDEIAQEEPYEEYPYQVMWSGSRDFSCEFAPDEAAEESISSGEPMPPEPIGWVEPDFCAMI